MGPASFLPSRRHHRSQPIYGKNSRSKHLTGFAIPGVGTLRNSHYSGMLNSGIIPSGGSITIMLLWVRINGEFTQITKAEFEAQR
jgi:hypothetical protein